MDAAAVLIFFLGIKLFKYDDSVEFQKKLERKVANQTRCVSGVVAKVRWVFNIFFDKLLK